MTTRTACPRCGRPASGSPWGPDHCSDHRCELEEHNATPPHLRRGTLSLTARYPGLYAAAVWVNLPSGRQFVIKSGDTVPCLTGAARDQYVDRAIGRRAQLGLLSSHET